MTRILSLAGLACLLALGACAAPHPCGNDPRPCAGQDQTGNNEGVDPDAGAPGGTDQ